MNTSSKPRPIVLGALVAGLYITTATNAIALNNTAGPQIQIPQDCSSFGYISTGTSKRIYQIDLATGNNQLNSHRYRYETNGKTAKLDALGYNAHDSYLYGWDHIHKQPVRVNQSGSVEVVETTNTPDAKFYAGDVSLQQNRYYVYRPGQAYGLYYLELDQSNPDYGQFMHVEHSERINLQIGDIAFHPNDNFAYAVDINGDVHQIDPQRASSEKLGNTGLSGRFGAAFFDQTGDLYVGQNNTGKLYKIPLNAGSVEAVLVSEGPSTTLSDGFRCAHNSYSNFPTTLLNESVAVKYDFGNAPNSYGTRLAANGARHEISSRFLGDDISVENDAYTYPLTDKKGTPNEQGVSFITTLVKAQTAHIQVRSEEGGYLSAWIDVNRNGEFDDNDQVLQDYALASGEQRVTFTVPSTVNAGESWARFRLSGTKGLGANGPAKDGEVEDYPVVVLEDPSIVSSYPSNDGFVTVAFEDNWPFVGDYDMNDLVTQLRTHTYRNELGFTRVDIKGIINAAGSQYENGFAIRLPGVARNAINEQDLEFTINGHAEFESPLEPNRKEAIFIITENTLSQVDTGPYCSFYRTEPGCGARSEFEFSLSILFNEPQSAKLEGVFDPFLFATPGAFHGGHFKTPPGRSYEVHLKNQAPTEAFDLTLFGAVGQDRTSQQNGTYFHTANGMPWAIEIGNSWVHPQEMAEIAEAYPLLEAWIESSGTVNPDWYLPEHASSVHVFSQ